MTLVLQLPPESEAQIKAAADARGVPLEEVVTEAVAEWVANQQHNARLEAWNRVGSYSTRQDAGFPPLSDADIDRASIYEGRGE